MDSRAPMPELQLDGKRMPLPTYEVQPAGHVAHYPLASALTSDDKAVLHLRTAFLLTDDERFFLTKELLCEVLSRKLIARELERYESASQLTRAITVDEISPPIGQDKPGYLTIFALLLLVDRGHEITMFVDHQLSDEELPLVLSSDKGCFNLCRAKLLTTPLQCFKDWKDHDKEYFYKWQYQLSVPVLTLDADKARHYKFDSRTVLPWCKRDASSSDLRAPGGGSGGYGAVTRVVINKRCHGFRDILQKLRLNEEDFALKTLHETEWNDEEKFRNEFNQLKYFNGNVHPHLVTLLATFTFQKKYHFLFPYAQCDLEHYWEREFPQQQPFDITRVRWFSRQVCGLMGAIYAIHNPLHIQDQYGRHGDLKPDNILWYRCTNDDLGIFVVSDMGLSDLHREGSRSNIPNNSIPATPGYRPPECDIDGGTISRAYDIWTLGCLFMDMVVWFLGGFPLLQKFIDARMEVIYILTGVANTIFFDLKEFKPDGENVQGSIKHVVQIKPQVFKWFDRIHADRSCSQFIHDILDTIENEMLVILAEGRRRSPSSVLKAKFDSFHKQCEA